jgi:asparagine synthase (glutamine-hydrolysing)
MCGIVGKITWQGAPPDRALIERMNEKLRHRGPDEGGLWMGGNAALAMRRLKIIDLATGQQPMSNEGCPHAGKTGPLRLVYNGEIYNFRALRAQLEKSGHKFRTHSDTETVLHAYEEWGEWAWDQLDGMYALALYVEKEKTLLLARDRMGIKPLYYRTTATSVSFASELKALLEDPETSREWNPQSVNEYFSLRYIPTPRSVYKEIRKLEPGHVLKVSAGKVENRRYWDFSPPAPSPQPLASYLEQLDALIASAVNAQMVSDVPLGVFLSGGLDSTTLAAYVHKAGVTLDSFTIYFGDQSYSERSEAAAVARMYGLRHNELAVHANVPDIFPKLAETFDEPFADPSIIPTWYLCQFARKRVTVALSGDGGDELFAGYPTYLADRLASIYRYTPSFLHKLLVELSRRLPTSHDRISFDYRVKAFLASARRPAPDAHMGWQEMFFAEERRSLYTPEFLERVKGFAPEQSARDAYASAGSREGLEKMLWVDQRTHLLDEYLVKVDRCSMAHSLEVRPPFLHRSLVEFAASVPMHYKLRGWTTKWMLRKLMKGRLPPDVLHGEKKGFTPPLARWLASDLKDWAAARLEPDRVRKAGILNADYPTQLLEEHAAQKRDHFRRLWTLICFMGWVEGYGGRNH